MSLVFFRGRTRGRAVVDEEDSMDGTEITESIGFQDTGEGLPSAFLLHCVHVCYVCSDVRTVELAHPGTLMQSASKGYFGKGSLSLLQKDE